MIKYKSMHFFASILSVGLCRDAFYSTFDQRNHHLLLHLKMVNILLYLPITYIKSALSHHNNQRSDRKFKKPGNFFPFLHKNSDRLTKTLRSTITNKNFTSLLSVTVLWMAHNCSMADFLPLLLYRSREQQACSRAGQLNPPAAPPRPVTPLLRVPCVLC